MENTKVPRPLIFRERRSLEEFFDNNPLNETLVDNMSNVYFMQKNFKERALKCMNTAYYICTLMLRERHPEWNFDIYCDLAFCENKDNKIHQAVTLSLVSIYINGLCEDQRQKLQKLKKQLDDYMNSILRFIQYGDPLLHDCLYSDILKIIKRNLTYYSIDEKEFAFRVIDKEAVRDVMEIKSFNWVTFVDFFRESRVRELVDYYGSTEDEKHNVVDILRQAANGFYSMGYNDKPEEVNKMLDTIEDEIHKRYKSEAEKKLYGADSVAEESMADSVTYEARIKELEAEIENLQKKLQQAQETIEEFRQPVKELTAKQKIRMEFAVQLLLKAGLTEDNLNKENRNKSKVASLLSLLLGIGSTICANFLVDRNYCPQEKDRETILELDKLCLELGISAHLSTQQKGNKKG